MIEAYSSVQPERGIPADAFMQLITMTGGSAAEVRATYPHLVKQFVGDHTTYTDLSPGIDDHVTPYGPPAAREFQPGTTVRSRGIFRVEDDDQGGHTLDFQGGVWGKRFHLGPVDSDTAFAFSTFGPVFVEADVAITGGETAHNRQPAQLLTITGIQEVNKTVGELLNADERVLVEGYLAQYEAGLSDQRERDAVGLVALTPTSGLYRPTDARTSFAVRLASGQLVNIQQKDPGAVYYMPSASPTSLPVTPSVGDIVRVAARHSEYHDGHYGLQADVLQLVMPSPNRAAYNQHLEAATEASIAMLGETPRHFRASLTLLLEMVAYRDEGKTPRLRLSHEQWGRIAQYAERVYADCPEDMPVVLLAQAQGNEVLQRAVESHAEGTPAFSVSPAELKTLVHDELLTQKTYAPGREATATFQLLGDVVPEAERVEMGREVLDIIARTGTSESYAHRAARMVDVVGFAGGAEAARLTTEAALSYRLPPFQAVTLLRKAVSYFQDSEAVRQPGRGQFEALGIYLDAAAVLEDRLAAGPDHPGARARMAALRRESLDKLATSFYQAARAQHLLP